MIMKNCAAYFMCAWWFNCTSIHFLHTFEGAAAAVSRCRYVKLWGMMIVCASTNTIFSSGLIVHCRCPGNKGMKIFVWPERKMEMKTFFLLVVN